MPVYPLQSPVTYTNVSNHGVFVAGLAHAVAPHSQIHLVRVLNDEGQGTLFWLAEALTGVISTTLRSNQVAGQVGLNKTVINLSLGLDPPENPEDVGITEKELDLIREQTDAIKNSMPSEVRAILDGLPPNSTDRIPIVALETPLAIAYSYGAVIVAAAGNESRTPPAAGPEPPLIPARYPPPFVIGVAGSDQGLGRSCFSNAGAIAAPAGGLGPGQTFPPACTPPDFTHALNTCSAQGNVDCPYAVVSFSPSVTTTGYAIWLGTSFAAPQVSGLAALLLEGGGTAQTAYTDMLTIPITIPNLPKGIIDVQQTVP
jgi:subtilisin family serine protease